LNRPEDPHILPALLGALHQEEAEGTLLLEQNDGCRRIHWIQGQVVYLQSDVAGEQFGNYLLRQGILDLQALKDLLANEERFRLGEKVIQWGLMTVEERDLHLRSLQEQVMLHALEHPVLGLDWKPGNSDLFLEGDLRLDIRHRPFVWMAFQEVRNDESLLEGLQRYADWRWAAPSDLLTSIEDLPLTPQEAYAVSLLSPEPVGFATFRALSHGLSDVQCAKLLLGLWAIGGLRLVQGPLPRWMPEAPPPPEPVASVPTPEAFPSQAPEEVPLALDAESAPSGEPEAPSESLPMALALDEAPKSPESESETPEERAKQLTRQAKRLFQQGRMAEGIRCLEEAVRLNREGPGAYEAWILLGRQRMANPAWTMRAIEALQVAAHLRPKAAEPWTLMGEVYRRKGFLANAKASYRKALELEASTPIPMDLLPLEDPAEAPPPPSGLLGRFRSLLGGKEKD